jgi:DNA-3-methyladenine glycosylase II
MRHLPLDAARLAPMLGELAARDPDLAAALARLGPPPPRVREPGFATLLHVIVAQQISTRAAASIWRRLGEALGGEVTAGRFLALSEAELRACGLSGPKIRYGQGLAEAVASGALPVEELAAMEEEQAVAAITALKGFGRWSAEIYLLFALGRADAFPADDLALQVGYQRLKGLAERPSAKRLRELTAPWRPYRGAAAVFLWHLYGAATLDDVPRGGNRRQGWREGRRPASPGRTRSRT